SRLSGRRRARGWPRGGDVAMRPMPIRYVHDVEAARRFYETLGLRPAAVNRAARDGVTPWMELESASGALALHRAPEPGVEVQLAFDSEGPIEEVAERMRAAGYELIDGGIVDEAYGRAFSIEDPEGLVVTVTEYDRELYT